MRSATSLLFRLFGSRGSCAGPGWWEYVGSFGDDIFGDDDAGRSNIEFLDGLQRGVERVDLAATDNHAQWI